MAALLAGRLPREGYAALLRNLHPIYARLEAAQQHPRAHAAVQRLRTPALHRSAALVADLEALHGPHWAAALPIQPAAQAYGERLDALAEAGSAAVAAHVYTRCLGDLHGGQVLQRLLQRQFGPATPTAFYDFGPVERVAALRLVLREALASLPVSATECDTIVAEARWSFVQHQRLFEQLPGAAAPALTPR